MKAKSRAFFLFPSPLKILIELIILAFFMASVWLSVKYYKFRRTVKLTWVDYKIKKSDTLIDLAEKRSVSWRVLAQVNRIKPPFTVEKGKVIKVPPLKKNVKKTS